MSEETNPNEDLTGRKERAAGDPLPMAEDVQAFEAALAAIQPNRDRLDRRWRALLAKEADLIAGLHAEQRAEAPLPSPESEAAACPGHVFLCVHCGSMRSAEEMRNSATAAVSVRGRRRWAWPAAFSAMTAVAAVLLVLLVRPDEPRSVGEGSTSAAVPLKEVAHHTESSDETYAYEFSRWAAARAKGKTYRILTTGDVELCDERLARKVLGDIELVANGHTVSSPVLDLEQSDAGLTSRELLERMLKTTDQGGAASGERVH